MLGEEEFEEIDRWFAERGFALGPGRSDGDTVWVDLERLQRREVVWPRYGRGESESDSRRNARRRFEEEQ